MINQVLLSGLISLDCDVRLITDPKKPEFAMCEAMLITQDRRKEVVKEVKITFFNKLAKDFVKNIHCYKEALTMYTGEVHYYPKDNKTIIKIVERPQVISKIAGEAFYG